MVDPDKNIMFVLLLCLILSGLGYLQDPMAGVAFGSLSFLCLFGQAMLAVIHSLSLWLVFGFCLHVFILAHPDVKTRANAWIESWLPKLWINESFIMQLTKPCIVFSAQWLNGRLIAIGYYDWIAYTHAYFYTK